MSHTHCIQKVVVWNNFHFEFFHHTLQRVIHFNSNLAPLPAHTFTHNKKKLDRTVLIIAAAINANDTLALLNQLGPYTRSKILVIDTVGTVFNEHSEFYRTINRNRDKWMTGNLLVLTTLTAKLKHFLNATFTDDYNKIYGTTSPDSPHSFNDAETFAIARTIVQRLSDASANRSATATERQWPISDDRDAVNWLLQFSELELNSMTVIFEKFSRVECHRTMTTKTADLGGTTTAATEETTASRQTWQTTTDVNDNNNNNNRRNSSKTITKTMYNNGAAGSVAADTAANAGDSDGGACTSHNYTLVECMEFVRNNGNHLTNVTLGQDVLQLFCQQLAEYIQRSKMHRTRLTSPISPPASPANYLRTDWIPINFSAPTNTNATAFDHNLNDFLEFTAIRLMQTYNFTVNYNKSSGSAAAIDAPNRSKVHANDEVLDFCLLDVRLHTNELVNRTQTQQMATTTTHSNAAATAIGWRPVLILRQNELNQSNFVMHPLLAIIDNTWFIDSTHKFWTCGLLCWILAGIVILLLACILIGSITLGLAIR